MRGQSYFDTAHTYWDLHDGYLDTSFALDPDESDNRYRYSAWGASHTTFYAVTPETRDEVNAAAQRVQVYDNNWQMQSTASHFRVMAEISMGSDVLRVALRDVVLCICQLSSYTCTRWAAAFTSSRVSGVTA